MDIVSEPGLRNARVEIKKATPNMKVAFLMRVINYSGFGGYAGPPAVSSE